MNYCTLSSYIGVKTINLCPVKKTDPIVRRREKFKDKLRPYLPMYGKEMLNAFYLYWTEVNKSKTKMRFELERTWQLSLRLQRWHDTSKTKGNKITPKSENTQAAILAQITETPSDILYKQLSPENRRLVREKWYDLGHRYRDTGELSYHGWYLNNGQKVTPRQ